MQTLEQKAVLVQITTNFIGTSRKAPKPTEEVERNHNVQNAGSFYKALFDRKAFKQLFMAGNKAYNIHQRLSLPWINDNIRILPIGLLEQYNEGIAKAKEMYKTAIEEFVENYDDILEENKTRLGDLFDIADYPTKRDVESHFNININYFPIPTQEDFRVTAPENLINTLKSKYKNEMKTFENTAKTEVATRLDLALSNVIQKLDKTDRKVQDRLLTKIISVVNELRPLNITEDAGLDAIMKEIEDKIGKENATTLSENDELRRKKSDEIKALVKKLEDSFPEAKGKRSLVF